MPNTFKQLARILVFSGATLLAPTVFAGTIIALSAEAVQMAQNDLIRAVVFAEASSPTPKALANEVNRAIAGAIAIAKGYQKVKTQSGRTVTHPVYSKGGQIESWRMRSELTLESTDNEAMSELVGKLQLSLGVAGIQFLPSPETRKRAEDKAILDALAAFQVRGKLVADAMGKRFKIKQLSVGANGHLRPMMLSRAANLAAESSSMPMESGESLIQVTVNGEIELAE